MTTEANVAVRSDAGAANTRKPLRVALLGFGTVGRAVARILAERDDLRDRLQLTHVFNRGIARKRVDWLPATVVWTEDFDQILGSRPDVVVEVVGGVDTPYGWVRQALSQGASVVTANKLLMAAHAPELLALAATRDARVRFEAAVAGGVPIIDAIRSGLSGDRLTRVVGILNGTCNFILSRMTDGDSMAGALGEAQRLGFAEADPTSDVDGHDAAAKLSLLAGVAFRRYLRTADIPTRSIRSIDAVDFCYAKRLGGTIRQLAMAEADGSGGVQAFVGPALVDETSSFARNLGAQNLVMVSGRYGGATTFSGEGAGGHPTAVAVVSDLVAISRHGSWQDPGDLVWEPGTVIAARAQPYYLRFIVRDRLGIVASITSALSQHDINIDAVLQEPGFPRDRLPFVVTVEPCLAAALHAAMQEVESQGFHAVPPIVMPVVPREEHAAQE